MDIEQVSNNHLIQNNISNHIQKSNALEEKKEFHKIYETHKNLTNDLELIFQEASEKYGVDVNLLKAIGKAESDFRPNLTSHAGAMGIMQIMPATAREYGVTNPYDPKQNIMAGAREISELLTKYDGDLELSLAGYNAGMGNVAKYGGVPPFRETRNYIKKVTDYLNNKIIVGKDVGDGKENQVNMQVEPYQIANSTQVCSEQNSGGIGSSWNPWLPITYGQSIANTRELSLFDSSVASVEYQSVLKYMIESMALSIGEEQEKDRNYDWRFMI